VITSDELTHSVIVGCSCGGHGNDGDQIFVTQILSGHQPPPNANPKIAVRAASTAADFVAGENISL
jgi:hypothetical protein